MFWLPHAPRLEDGADDAVACFFSLAAADERGGRGELARRPVGDFAPRDAMRAQCAAAVGGADLAVLHTRARHAAASELVRAVREPHFLLADNPGDGGGAVVWVLGPATTCSPRRTASPPRRA